MTKTGPRMTAEERRKTVLAAATVEFAQGGLDGTSTDAIARRAGISQPYLFRLFPTKKALFMEAVKQGFARVQELFEQAVVVPGGELTGEDALKVMGDAYLQLLEDRVFLLVQLHAYAACDDAEVRATTRRGFRDLWYTVERISGVPQEQVRGFMAHGMLFNVVAAMDLSEVRERWARACSEWHDEAEEPDAEEPDAEGPGAEGPDAEGPDAEEPDMPAPSH
jgi:AcrR family transcriptional regulator